MNTDTPRLHQVEMVADLPVLWQVLEQLNFRSIVNTIFPAHTLWVGSLTPADLLALWLLFVLSRGDHCLNHLQPWVAAHLSTLSTLLQTPINPVDAQDDRLADWLDRLADTDAWNDLEQQLNMRTLRVYSLPKKIVRIDTTTANSYADVVSDSGLLQFGHSKDDSSRPQVKIATAVLDPLGMPLTTLVLPGNCADDPLYVPAVFAVQKSLGAGGKTYVGDSKMGSIATRATLVGTNDFYLCPLSEVQLGTEQRRKLLAPVFDGSQALTTVTRPGPKEDDPEKVAEGFCVDVELEETVGDKVVKWTERRWLVRSLAYAESQSVDLERRLTKAIAALEELTVRKQGKKRLDRAGLEEACAAVVSRERVVGLLKYGVVSRVEQKTKRAYGKHPATVEQVETHSITVEREADAIKGKKQELGWQVYATNQLELSIAEVLWTYRGQNRIEEGWGRLKGQTLGLTPMYLQKEERIQGLIRLLSVGLRILTILEWVVREKLRATGEKLQDVYAGQAGRKTATPSAELLLCVMKTISLSIVEVGGRVYALLSPLTRIQRQLLELWKMPADLYDRLANSIPKTFGNIGEP